MSDNPGTVSDSDKKRASQLMFAGAIVMGVLGLLGFALGAAAYGIIDFAIAGAIGYFGYARAKGGDFGVARMVTLICAAIIGLLGLLTLGSAGAAGGLGLLIALILLGTAGALVYAAILISPGRKLF